MKEIEIPEGYEARIEGNKVILEPKENEDEKIIDGMLEFFRHSYYSNGIDQKKLHLWIAYLEKQKEQKPAEWDEGDKDYYDAIIAKLEVTQDDAMLTDNQMDFLKSLPERINLQPKQEWDEEDEEMLNMIEYRLKDWDNIKTQQGYQDDYTLPSPINWLKSLCFQNHWKPSEEQMEALLELEETYVLEHEKTQETARLYVVIKSLREQLSELRKGEL